jgi:hypothetical protein
MLAHLDYGMRNSLPDTQYLLGRKPRRFDIRVWNTFHSRYHRHRGAYSSDRNIPAGMERRKEKACRFYPIALKNTLQYFGCLAMLPSTFF